MRILYLNCIETNRSWGAENFMHSALLAAGHAPHSVDYRKHRHTLCRRILNAPASDVLLVQKGDGVPAAVIHSVQRPRFLWAGDILGTRPGEPLEEQDAVYDRSQYRLLAAGLFDHVFFHTANCLETALSRGWVQREHCSVLLSAFHPTFHQPERLVERDIPVLFVGSMTPRRKQIIDEARKGCHIQVASAYGLEMVRLFNRAKIVLNIHAGPLCDTETRVYEALGCGAFLLTERLSRENPFSHRDLVPFDSVADLVEKVRYYLAHDDEREEIANHGRLSALRGHTYAHRAHELVKVMSAYLRPEDPACAQTVRRDWAFLACRTSETLHRLTTGLSTRGRRLLRTMRDSVRGPMEKLTTR